MKNYAQIVSTKVKNIAVFENEPLFQPDEGYWVNVTILNVGIGWSYDSNLNVFTKPEAEEPEKITIIANEDLWDRFLETEQENLLDSANKKIKRFLYELRIRPEFNLLDSKLISAINALESASIIGAGRTDEILN
jgi:hypothetical protein